MQLGQENKKPQPPKVLVWMEGVNIFPTVADLRRDRPHTLETTMHDRVR